MKKLLITLLPAFAFAAPNAPSNLTFSELSSHSITLNWVDNSEDETGFKIFKTSDNKTEQLIITTAPNQESFKVIGLKPDTTYTFTIKATDDTNSNQNTIFATNQNISHAQKDDAVTKRGTKRSYTKSGGIVTDKLTSLKWQDNSSSRSSNYNDAISYCQNLTIDGESNWRLPTIKELQTLVDYGSSPRIDSTFDTKRGSKFWSISEYPYDRSNLAYFIDFSRGFSADYGDRSAFEKSNRYYTRCVKGDKLPSSKFIRDDETNIVKDTTTNLMWEDTSHIEGTSSVEDAIGYCDSLVLGGFSDWALPNINELYSITDTSSYDSAIDPTFSHRLSIGSFNEDEHYRAANYWSSTYYGPHTELQNVHYYRTLNARDGASHRCRSYMGMHTRCVRSK
jgi:hypothetical protein